MYCRALSRLLEAAPELGVTDTQERVNPDLDRKKRIISRETVLKQGEQLMSELASSRSLIGGLLHLVARIRGAGQMIKKINLRFITFYFPLSIPVAPTLVMQYVYEQ